MKRIKYILLFFICLLFIGCLPFKYGKYYSVQEPKNISGNGDIFFYKDGKFESWFFSEGNKQLIQSGSWIERRNAIIVTIDSLYDIWHKSKCVDYTDTFTKKLINRNELIVRKRLSGKMHKAVWKYSS